MGKESLAAEVETRVLAELRVGFDTSERIEESVVNLLQDDYPKDLVEAMVSERMPSILRDWEAEKTTWPEVTDCDRLDEAFEELNALGILARHHWWCCGTCGAAAMPEEYEFLDGEWEGRPIIGYCFYHIQDSEGAAEYGGLCLNYGTLEACEHDGEYEAKSVRVAQEVVRVLEVHGLQVSWNGRFDQRPSVDMKWQRRARPKRFCEDDEG